MATEPPPSQIQGGTIDAEKLRDTLGGQLTEWLKLRTDQIEQKVDLKMDGIRGEVSAKLDNKPGHLSLIAHTLAVVVLIAAILAFGGDRFDGGMSASAAYAQYLVERERRDSEIDQKLDRLTNEIAAMRQEQAAGRKANAGH